MDCLSLPKEEFEFHYIYRLSQTNQDEEKNFKHTIKLPLEPNVTTSEYAFLLMKLYNLPEYVENDLIDRLSDFIPEKIDEIQCNQFKSLPLNDPDLMQKSKQFIEKLKAIAPGNETRSGNHANDFLHDENFYLMYHKIVHSGILTPQVIQLENHNSDVIKNLIEQKDEFLQSLSQEQNKKIEDILLSGTYSEKEINLLTKKNIILAEKTRNEWMNRIMNIRIDQKREFSTWIKNTYEDLMKENNKSASNSLDHDSLLSDDKEPFSDFVDITDELNMEESYTINLGSQLKTTHNLRLIAADMLKFCSNVSTPHRIQTAMSLYSNSLSGVVLLVDGSLSSSLTTKSDFAKLSLSASENHFPDFDSQLELIKSDLSRTILKRGSEKNGNPVRLNPGDVYITRHSNLSQAHVVFHIVTNESIENSEINSRHPVILGLRNILKIAYIYDISNIYIPLLLLHRMSEDITIQWCLRRAELILKCVKGFMIEMSSLLSISDSENKTIQFVVPKGISQELFSSLSAIFPNVFRLSNPLFLTTNNNQ